MSTLLRILVSTAFCATLWTPAAHAEKKTVCTITVNSADEKDTFRRNLPPDKFQFVELVERGRTDWLESACRQGIRCDILVVSGHYDGGNEFFSDRLEAREFLPVDEMERASCSGTCSGLFSQLKEVYLFGCNTLNAGANKNASAEIGRSLVRSGHSRGDAERLAKALGARHGESSRDRMRQVFKDVPAIYGFSSVAPLGPTAASLLQRHFQSGGAGEIGTGRTSARLLGGFAGHSMVAVNGVTAGDPMAAHRQDICQFSDDRLSAAQKLDFIHEVLHRETAEVRMFLERIERYSASLPDAERQVPAVAEALERIAADDSARNRYLEFARDADQVAVRARMLDLARELGWLTPEEQRSEVVRMIGDQLARSAVTAADVDQVCALNPDHALDDVLAELPLPGSRVDKVPQAAILACLGDAEAHARVLRALTSASDDEVAVAQVYLRHRPIGDSHELRAITTSVARMSGTEAKVRALESLARLRLSDRESLDELARLYPVAESPGVQTAIAGVLIRADYQVMAKPALVQTLRDYRLKSGAGQDVIDVLIRRLEAQ
jgi:hypothetical protein